MLSVSFSLTSAEILTLGSAPKVLVIAPPPGRVLVPIALALKYTFGTVPYTIGGQLWLAWGDPANDVLINTNMAALITNVQDETTQGAPTGLDTISQPPPLWDNQPLSLYQQGGDPTLGDGLLEGTLFYAIASLP